MRNLAMAAGPTSTPTTPSACGATASWCRLRRPTPGSTMLKLPSSTDGSGRTRARNSDPCARSSQRRYSSSRTRALRPLPGTSQASRCAFRESRGGARTRLPRRPTRWPPCKPCFSVAPGLQIRSRSPEVGQLVLLLFGQVERCTREITMALLLWSGLGEQEALGEPATQLAQLLQLLPTLDTLCDHLDVEMSCHGNDCTDNRKITHIRHQVADETAVDLDVIHPPALQVGEARVAGPEIVNRNPHTQLAQA